MKESEIQKQIIDYLKVMNIIVIRNNSGRINIGKRWINLGDAGSSDLIAMHPISGKLIAIEVKSSGEKLRDKQIEFRDKVLNGNGIHITAYSLQDVIIKIARG